jgi:phytanoyl-CoA hydroxylase
MQPWYVVDRKSEHSKKILTAPESIQKYLRDICENGYTVIPEAVDTELVVRAKNAYFAFKDQAKNLAPPTENGRHRRVVNLHCAIPPLVDLFATNKALPILDFLFDEESSLYTSLFYEVGSSQDIHRDTPYFWTNPGYNHFGVWVALEDVDEHNGCLQVVPKSHLLQEEDRRGIAAQYYANIEDVPNADDRLWLEYQARAQQSAALAELSVVDVCVQAGDTIIWHPHSLHGGRVIVDHDRTRLSLVIHTTGINQAVYHHSGFFNTEARLASHYEKVNIDRLGRKYVSYDMISFGHQLDVPVDLFLHGRT